MKIAVLGTGVVGQTLAARLAGLGHEVVVGTRDPEATLARTEPDRFGNPPLRDWLAAHRDVRLAGYADAGTGADLVVNATSGEASEPALTAVGKEALTGTVVLDIANPLDMSHGFPPRLSVKDDDSLTEQLQRAFPEARIVKALNTMNAYLMVDPEALAGGDHSVFISGDDAAAKEVVTDLLRSFGWRDIIDLGDLSTARGSEMYVALWVRLLTALNGNAQFNIKVVR